MGTKALVFALADHKAAEFIGWPKARIPIAEAYIHIATTKKYNSAYKSIGIALQDIAVGLKLALCGHL